MGTGPPIIGSPPKVIIPNNHTDQTSMITGPNSVVLNGTPNGILTGSPPHLLENQVAGSLCYSSTPIKHKPPLKEITQKELFACVELLPEYFICMRDEIIKLKNDIAELQKEKKFSSYPEHPPDKARIFAQLVDMTPGTITNEEMLWVGNLLAGKLQMSPE